MLAAFSQEGALDAGPTHYQDAQTNDQPANPPAAAVTGGISVTGGRLSASAQLDSEPNSPAAPVPVDSATGPREQKHGHMNFAIKVKNFD